MFHSSTCLSLRPNKGRPPKRRSLSAAAGSAAASSRLEVALGRTRPVAAESPSTWSMELGAAPSPGGSSRWGHKKHPM